MRHDPINPYPLGTLGTIKAMRELLTDPKAWLQGNFAGIRQKDGSVDELGSGVMTPEANCWCLVGAAMKVNKTEQWAGYPGWERELAQTLNQLHCQETVPGFNDGFGTTHADVIRVLDTTIARLEAKP